MSDEHPNDVDVPTDEGVFTSLELDTTINRNDFTPEQAAKVFENAAKACKDTTGEVLKDIMDGAFKLLPIVVGLL